MSRVLQLLVVPAWLFAVQPSWAIQPEFRLQVVPEIVYKVDDPGNSHTSSFVFDIAVICSTDCALTPMSARVELSSAGSTVERQDWTTEMLAKIKNIRYRIEPNTPLASPTRAFTSTSRCRSGFKTSMLRFTEVSTLSQNRHQRRPLNGTPATFHCGLRQRDLRSTRSSSASSPAPVGGNRVAQEGFRIFG